jgi:FlaA1/EpsC-like NDP-sugar epimerase
LIYGADDTGEIALRWILRNRELGWTPVAFLDEDTLMKGQYIHGVQVMGGVENLGEVLRMRNIDGMVVTTNSFLNSPAGVKLVQTCRDQGVWIRVLHLEFEPIE